jgi:hypothetical protein
MRRRCSRTRLLRITSVDASTHFGELTTGFVRASALTLRFGRRLSSGVSVAMREATSLKRAVATLCVVLFASSATATMPYPPLSHVEALPAWNAPLLFEDAGRYAPFRADAWPGPAAREVKADVSLLEGPFAFEIGGRRYWKTENVMDEEAEHVVMPRLSGTRAFRFYSTDGEALSTITTDGKRMAGYIEAGGERWFIRPAEGGLHLLVHDDGAPIDCRISEADRAEQTSRRQIAVEARQRSVRKPGEEVVVIPMWLLFHSRVEAHLGGRAEMLLVLQSLADAENTALIETGGTATRFALVRSEQVDDPDKRSGTPRPDWNELLGIDEAFRRLKEDNYVRQVRYDERLSIVGYFDMMECCGGRSSMLFGEPHRNSGMFIAAWNDAGIAHAVVHEIGHIPGLDHNREIAISSASCAYCFGLLDCTHERSDEMSGSSAAHPCFTRSFPGYSNPDRLVAGLPFGSLTSNAARRIREMRYVMRDGIWVHALD